MRTTTAGGERAARTPHRLVHDQAGMTLVEVMVAILVIGLILSALASVLTMSLRTIAQNERESTATAFAQQEIERMQAVDWEFAGLLQSEVDAAPSGWTDRLDSPATTFDGEALVLVTAPSGATQRPEQIPHLTEQIVRQNTTYDVSRYVTWVDRTANGSEETRRFTVVMSWQVLGKPREITVTAERIPTLGEAVTTEAGTRLLNFFRSPDPAALVEDGTTQQGIRVEVRLSQGVMGARLRYHTATPVYEDLDENGLPDAEPSSIAYDLKSPPMTEIGAAAMGGGHAVWELIIPAGDGPFVEGIMPLQFVANELDGDLFEVYGSIKLTGSDVAGSYPSPPSLVTGETDGSTDPTPQDPDVEDPGYTGEVQITSALITSSACRYPTTWKLSKDLTLQVKVTGLTEFDPVTATYTYRSKKKVENEHLETATEAVDFVTGNEDLATFELTLPANGDRYFAEGDRIDFTVTASRDSKNASATTEAEFFLNQGTAPC